MANSESSNSSDVRDSNQRSLGFVGLSAIAHIGVLMAVLLAPSFKSQSGGVTGAQAGTELSYAGSEVADPSAPAAASAPTEVLLADATDADAVTMPTTQAEEIVPAPKVEPVAEVKPVREVKPVAVKPKAVEAKPKVVAAKAQPPIQTATDSDVEIKAALEKARTEKAPEKVPEIVAETTPEKTEELPAELDAPEMPEEKIVEQPKTVPTIETSVEAAKAEEVAQQEAPAAPATEKIEAPVAAKSAQAEAAPATSSVTPSTTSGSTSALQAPNANGAGTLGRSGGGDASTFGSAGANAAGAPGVGAGAPIRDVSDLVAMAGNPKPSYPLQDKMSGKQGTTVLVGQVKADGSVSNVAVERSSGSFQMDRAASQAFSKWRFRPGQAGMVRSPFQFQLVGDAKEVPARLRTQ